MSVLLYFSIDSRIIHHRPEEFFYIRVYFTLLSNNVISLRMLLDIKTRVNLSRYNFIDFNCLCK